MIKMFRQYVRENPLGNRVLASILCCSTFLACFATAFQLFVDYRHNMSGIELRMSEIERSYPDTLAASMWNVDNQQIETQIQGIANLPDIVDVQLQDAEGKIIEHAGMLQHSHLVVTQEFPIHYKKDASSSKPVFLGKLIVTANVERIYAELRNKALVILASQTTKTMLVAFFSLFIFNYLVSRHLSVLATYAREIDLEHLDKPLILPRATHKEMDELDVVVSAFNVMAASIKTDYDEIKKYRANLEALVEERTAALAQKVCEKEEVIRRLNHEIKERLLVEREALDNEQRYRQLVEMLPDAITVEVNNKITFFNNSLLALLQTENIHDIQEKSIFDFIPQEFHHIVHGHLEHYAQDKKLFECKMIRFDGSLVNVEMTQAVFNYKGQPATQTIIHDITKHKDYEEQLRQQALHDALTGLPNRLLLSDRIKQEIALAERQKQCVYVVFLDLDRFKYVNDTLGHNAGDELLKILSVRMSKCLRKSDTLARLGGDEFVIVIGRVKDEKVVFKLIKQIMDAISAPIMLNDHEISVSASAGISNYPTDGSDATTLLRHADSAMYQAKVTGLRGAQHYSNDMHDRVNEHLVMESHLRHALEREELLLHYQPVVDIRTGQIVGAEALIRWQHPTLGMVFPARFIPLAEEIGLILPIGNWVIHTACHQAKLWQKAFPSLRMSVNLSVQQLVRPGLEHEITRILDETGLAPEYLELEITESASMAGPEKMAVLLGKLKAMGLKLAIDDFGVGYSNLSYLKELPVHHLKLDRIFIHNIQRSAKDAILVRSIVEIAHNLNLRVVAEGVEEAEQLQELILCDCDEMQGYYFHAPVPADQFYQILQDNETLPEISQLKS